MNKELKNHKINKSFCLALEDGKIVIKDCKIADSFWKRFVGLMGKKGLGIEEGLYLDKCSSVHMFFMRFPLDIIFLDKNSSVVKVYEGLKPWRVTKIVNKAKSVVELPKNTIQQKGIEVGAKLFLKDLNLS